MNNVKSLLLVGMAVVILGGVAGVMIAKRQATRGGASQPGKVADARLAQVQTEVQLTAPPAVNPAAPPASDVGVPREAIAPPDHRQPLKPVQARGQENRGPLAVVAQANQGRPAAKEPLQDPMAREALAFVGADEWAEAYWYEAINDPSLPANERQDLIEDLNEDGLSDPRHPTEDDLPLILSRLLIIEEVAWDAMDEVNADAFQEAYKDLVNLADLAMGGGNAVR